MVLAISTPATQAIAGKTSTIPIIATAVTSYIESGLVDSNEEPGGNISGTSDMNPIAEQIKLGIKLFPDTKTVGIIYNSSETNSVLQANIAKAEIENFGLSYSESTVTNSNDVYQAMESLVTRSDLIYIPTDNTLASTMPTVGEIAIAAKIPVMLLLLDEHTAALDPKTAAIVLELSDKLIKCHNLTALMVTHNMKDAIKYGNRVIMVDGGKIIFDASGDEKKNLTVREMLDKFTSLNDDGSE